MAQGMRTLSKGPGRALAEPGNDGHLGRGVCRPVAEEHPDVALHLARRIGLDRDAADLELLALDQRRDGGAPPAGIEAPAVIAAFDLAAVEPSVAQRDAAMGTNVAEREDRARRRRPKSTGSPSSILATVRPLPRRLPGRAKYHVSLRGAAASVSSIGES